LEMKRILENFAYNRVQLLNLLAFISYFAFARFPALTEQEQDMKTI
jgi:hypothetical protein